ncbi:MAG: sigma-70 family RNA polymerase sigma factor [Phycisphaerae bacterium]|nr:sigma-70 family RNA polymerase sigma factor [Phycisphaerae bacterium]
MATRFALPWMETFAAQLLRGPRRFRLQQLTQIDFLLSVVEAGKTYPTDFVVHALTGYRAKGSTAREKAGDLSARDLLEGTALREDLVLLAETLSESAEISVESYPGKIFTVESLAERFDVSTKTIFRWRRRGLVAWKLKFDDGRIRVAFSDRSVQRFVTENTELVQRGANFTQLSTEERAKIVAQAEELVAGGMKTVNAVAKAVAETCGRAVETIRLILKAHDDAHPGAGIFNRQIPGIAADDQRLAIWSAYCDGQSIAAISQRVGKSTRSVYAIVTQMRALERRRTPIEFIASDEFEQSGADALVLKDASLKNPYKPAEIGAASRTPANLPPYLKQLFSLPLLTPQGEAALFRKMNYLKFKAERMRKALDPASASAAELDRIDALLEESCETKNQIMQANLRLVVSIAKRHASPTVDFFEIVSDGNISLMRAIEKFDYSRGFKFSTYASWAIIKNFARSLPDEHTHRDRYQTGREEYLETVSTGPAEDEAADERREAARAMLDRMLSTLDSREREILVHRFGVESGGEPQTLEQIGRRVGVSKERIRQIEARAMSKLRAEFGDAVGLEISP